ncbi:LacI family DNA-binding transcriptional regulator [Pseudonocardia sp. MH-G8]|uniref:LacI family DNA-binding transcriptional regulator n=1 Tax=Pseudonocardia sp. MH-G8 TaxID=1854588 RepID=UPI000B9F9D78|nr:LacI family transcriptional regulator [Pseudonocardia sp. MH-G8]
MIASHAGVSTATVSKVLNGRPDVSADTRARVSAVLREHDYRPVGLRASSERRAVDVVFDDLSSPYSAAVLAGALDAGVESGVTVVARRYSDETDAGWAARVRARECIGYVVVSAVLTPTQADVFDVPGVPLVVIDAVGLPRRNLMSVGATNFTGGFTATEHLIQLGHRRIAHLGGTMAMACHVARLHGYRAALERAGIPVDSSLIANLEGDYEAGVEQGRAWLGRPDSPTAVFAGFDLFALGVIEAARARSLRVPGDVSVVGFDDSYAAQWSSPPLTTVRQPLRELGALALRRLLQRAAGEEMGSHHIELATHLVVRTSTAPPSDPGTRP